MMMRTALLALFAATLAAQTADRVEPKKPGVWTHYKIDVDGRRARLYVNGADQPCLVVNDMRHEPQGGRVALWVGPGTEGYFANLKVTAR
jgi:hypothetical protein